jgi:hypothetical protein
MPSQKALTTINISLVLISALLILTLFDVHLPSLGQAFFIIDQEDPLLVVNWKDDYNSYNLQRGCFEARQQAECLPVKKVLPQGEVDWVCQSGNSVKYWLNNKAYYQCTQLWE